MKHANLISIAAVAFLLTTMCPMPAFADLQGIVNDYCAEAESDAQETRDELQIHKSALRECLATYQMCLRGDFGIAIEDCASDYRVCTRDRLWAFRKACSLFLVDFRSDTKHAQRQAYFEGIKDDFLDWFSGDTSVVSDPSSEECLWWDRPSHIELIFSCAGPAWD